MSEQYKMAKLTHSGELSSVKDFGTDAAQKVNGFHKSFPEYSVTPLRELTSLASRLGVKGFYVKDESYRFNLNAFKVLGGVKPTHIFLQAVSAPALLPQDLRQSL